MAKIFQVIVDFFKKIFSIKEEETNSNSEETVFYIDSSEENVKIPIKFCITKNEATQISDASFEVSVDDDTHQVKIIFDNEGNITGATLI